MRSLCASLLLLSSSVSALAADTGAIQLAAPGLKTVNLAAELARFYAEHLGQKLAFQGIRVVTAGEIQALIGLERQRQLLGCSEDDQCVSDIAGALGADALLVGDVAKIGSTLHFNLRIVSSRDGDRLAAFTARVEGEDAVLTTLDRAAEAMASELSRKLGRPLLPAAGAQTQQLSTGPRAFAWIPGAAGVAFAGAGVPFLVFAHDRHLRLNGSEGLLTGVEAERLRRDGALFQTVGLTGVALGVVGAGAAAGLFLLGGGQSTVQTGLSLSPSGASITFSGVIP